MTDPITAAAVEINRRLAAIEADIVALKGGTPVPPIPVPPPPPTAGQKAVVTMGHTGCDATNFKAAYDMVQEGGTINVMPGTYNDSILIKKDLTINGAGAFIKGKAYGEKAAFVVAGGDVTLTGFDIGPITGTEGNIACVRVTEGCTGITLRGVRGHDTKMGVLAKVTGDILVEDSDFHDFASSGTNPHALYITEASSFILRNSSVTNSKDGHLVKSGAQKTLIEGNKLAALDSKASRTIDAFGGGTLTVRNNVLQVNKNTSNHFISYASESARLNDGPHVVLIESNTFINDSADQKFSMFRPKAPLVSPVAARALHNTIIGTTFGWPAWITGDVTTRFATRADAGLPAYDYTLASVIRGGTP